MTVPYGRYGEDELLRQAKNSGLTREKYIIFNIDWILYETAGSYEQAYEWLGWFGLVPEESTRKEYIVKQFLN
jgi:hypothetical protein